MAAALEARPPDFDWRRCLGCDPLPGNYVLCALTLAHEVLDARIADTPAGESPGAAPRWAIDALLHAWGNLTTLDVAGRASLSI